MSRLLTVVLSLIVMTMLACGMSIDHIETKRGEPSDVSQFLEVLHVAECQTGSVALASQFHADMYAEEVLAKAKTNAEPRSDPVLTIVASSMKAVEARKQASIEVGPMVVSEIEKLLKTVDTISDDQKCKGRSEALGAITVTPVASNRVANWCIVVYVDRSIALIGPIDTNVMRVVEHVFWSQEARDWLWAHVSHLPCPEKQCSGRHVFCEPSESWIDIAEKNGCTLEELRNVNKGRLERKWNLMHIPKKGNP